MRGIIWPLKREKYSAIPIKAIIGLSILDAAANITEQMIMVVQIVANAAAE